MGATPNNKMKASNLDYALISPKWHNYVFKKHSHVEI